MAVSLQTIPTPRATCSPKGTATAGLCVGLTGVIYSSEHGQYNSDEFNILEAGRNYGSLTSKAL